MFFLGCLLFVLVLFLLESFFSVLSLLALSFSASKRISLNCFALIFLAKFIVRMLMIRFEKPV